MGLSKPQRTLTWNPEPYHFQGLGQDVDPEPITCEYRTMHPTLFGSCLTQFATNGGAMVDEWLKEKVYKKCTRNFQEYIGIKSGADFAEFGHAVLQEEMFWHIFAESQLAEEVKSNSEPLSTGSNGAGQRSTSSAPKPEENDNAGSISTTTGLTPRQVDTDHAQLGNADLPDLDAIAAFTQPTPTQAGASR